MVTLEIIYKLCAYVPVCTLVGMIVLVCFINCKSDDNEKEQENA